MSSYDILQMAASNTVLRHGNGLASLMYRYQGLDWRDAAQWGCNAMLDPTEDGCYDGVSVHPLEVGSWHKQDRAWHLTMIDLVARQCG